MWKEGVSNKSNTECDDCVFLKSVRGEFDSRSNSSSTRY